MSGVVWSKFFWSDWEGDPKLRLCSAAAQGLWMRMLCICAQAEPQGYLTLNGRALGPTDLAAITGWPSTDVESWLDELARWGVYSIDRKGRIYSRRLIKDARKLKTARANGVNGGNPKLKGGYNRPGFVYVVGRRADGAYKIGASVNPANRLKKLRAQYPGHDLRVLDAVPTQDMGDLEADLHKTFSEKKDGEWFRLTPLEYQKLKGIFETLKGPAKGRDKAQKPEARSQTPVIGSEDKSSGAFAPPDVDGAAWASAVLLLTDQGGLPEKSARSLFGKLLSENGLEARDLLPAVTQAVVNRTQDPVAYLRRSAAGIAKRRADAKPRRVAFV